MAAEFFDLDIKAMNKALDLVQQWSSHTYITQLIKVNLPAVWVFAPGTGQWAGKKVLQEPFIENYQKFNSNTGWADSSTPWPQLMQALSHFSFHASGGQYVLCDLQGGVYSNAVVLTDPVILSRDKSYGVTDLGPRGISSFFSNHKCNSVVPTGVFRRTVTGITRFRWARAWLGQRCGQFPSVTPVQLSLVSMSTNTNKLLMQ
jgi:hypothetical protein